MSRAAGDANGVYEGTALRWRAHAGPSLARHTFGLLPACPIGMRAANPS